MYNLTFLGFYHPTVAATGETVITFPQVQGTAYLTIINDGSVTVYYSLNDLPVDTTDGLSGGIIHANEVQNLPVRTDRIALKAASATAAVRIWAYGP